MARERERERAAAAAAAREGEDQNRWGRPREVHSDTFAGTDEEDPLRGNGAERKRHNWSRVP